MSSEAITQNDLREILSRTVGSVPSEYKKLLWTNPSPTSAMSTATIVASGADNYDAIEVVYKTAHIYNGYETALSPFVAGSHITLLAPSGTGGEFSGAIYNAMRTISMGAGGSLGVDNAIGMTSSGTTGNNNMCIPYKVYGIKYGGVSSPMIDAIGSIKPTKDVTLAPVKSSVTIDYTLPAGATIMSISISRQPNGNWVNCGINSYSTTSCTIVYDNTYSGNIAGTFELSIIYKVE